VFLLVFSKDANSSAAVAKEVERAVLGYKKTVIPFRIEDTAMSENLEFFLTDVHWLDAFPDDTMFDNLVTAVKNILGMAAAPEAQVSPPTPAPSAHVHPAPSAYVSQAPAPTDETPPKAQGSYTKSQETPEQTLIAPSQVPVTSEEIPDDSDVFVPKGVVTVVMQDGTEIRGVANSAYFCTMQSNLYADA